MLAQLLKDLLERAKQRIETKGNIVPLVEPIEQTTLNSESLLQGNQRQPFNEGTSEEDFWEGFTEEEEEEIDKTRTEMMEIWQNKIEKSKRKSAKKAKRKATRSGKPKISEDTDLSSPWVIDSEEQDIIRKGMYEGGPSQPDYQELIDDAAQYHINASAEGWFMKDLEQNKHESAIAISRSTFELEEKSKADVLSDIEKRIENMKAIEAEDPTGEDVGANPLEDEMPHDYRKGQQEGGPIDEQMNELMPEEEAMPIEMAEEDTETMLPDEEMEDNYTDFVINEALDEEEEQYLLDRLSGDDQLSMIFDKVVETASEFSGSGSVEGPGSAVSDSIPARLSDGEFVITSKAANQIGPDTLQELMELAEQEANMGRQTAQTGGYVQEEEEEEKADQPIVSEKALPTGRILPESEASKRAKANADLLNPRMSLFAS